MNSKQSPSKARQTEQAVVRFAGDSGDGMQLAGLRFSSDVAWSGKDMATFPDFPADIRAPAGSPYGVSSFQVRFGSSEVLTAGGALDVLVAMNPAALKVNIADLRKGGILVVNDDAFDEKNLKKAGYGENPLLDPAFAQNYVVYRVPVDRIVMEANQDVDLPVKEKARSRNFFAVGLISWLFQVTTHSTESYLQSKFKDKPKVVEVNLRALKAGYNYGETAEMFESRFQFRPTELEPGLYTSINGNTAVGYALAAAAVKSGHKVVYCAYPITPASEVLHEAARLRQFGVRAIQAEDEIAACGMALGASFAGALGVTVTSGPGLDLKSEMIGLAVISELPLVIVDVQRAGPSTGMPTKPEQSDLLMAVYGRHGDAPLPVIAPSSPVDCFWATLEAIHIAVEFMTPVIVLSDGYLANCSEPWKIPDPSEIPEIKIEHARVRQGQPFQPYGRDPKTLARPWAIPGTPELEHRIGGLEKKNLEGTVCYDPDNHDLMARLREDKIRKIQERIPPCEVYGAKEGEILLVGWGSSFGSIRGVAKKLVEEGVSVGHLHLRYIHPLPSDLGGVLKRYKKVLVPEINRGQLVKVLRDATLVNVEGFHQLRGRPLNEVDLEEAVRKLLKMEAVHGA